MQAAVLSETRGKLQIQDRPVPAPGRVKFWLECTHAAFVTVI